MTSISNGVHCVKEGKCGFKSQLAAKNGFPCQFVGCVERLPSLPTSKKRESIIRNQTLDDVKEAMLSSNDIRGDCMRDAIRVINSLRSEQS